MISSAFNYEVEEPYATSNKKHYRNYDSSQLLSNQSSSKKKLLEVYSTKSLLEKHKDVKEIHDHLNQYNDPDKFVMAPNRYEANQWKLMAKDETKPYIGHANDLNRHGYEHTLKH